MTERPGTTLQMAGSERDIGKGRGYKRKPNGPHGPPRKLLPCGILEYSRQICLLVYLLPHGWYTAIWGSQGPGWLWLSSPWDPLCQPGERLRLPVTAAS